MFRPYAFFFFFFSFLQTLVLSSNIINKTMPVVNVELPEESRSGAFNVGFHAKISLDTLTLLILQTDDGKIPKFFVTARLFETPCTFFKKR